MSLMQLLTVGKSFRTIDDRPSPYRMMQQNYLPRFGPMHGGGVKEPTRPLQPPRPTQPKPAWAGVQESARVVAKAVGPRVAQGAAKAAPGERTRGVRRWFGWGRKAGGRRAGAQVVQGELALDLVKVVRNDLSESDLEVVPAVPRPASPPEERPATVRRQARSAEKGSWGWLARCVLRLGGPESGRT